MLGEATIKLKPQRERQLRARGLEALFELIFYRKPSLGRAAKEFVETIETKNEGKGLPISEWREWSRQHQITQRQFYDMANKLKGVGMIRRERDQWVLSRDFSRVLNEMASIWDAWRGSFGKENEDGDEL